MLCLVNFENFQRILKKFEIERTTTREFGHPILFYETSSEIKIFRVIGSTTYYTLLFKKDILNLESFKLEHLKWAIELLEDPTQEITKENAKEILESTENKDIVLNKDIIIKEA